MGRVRILVLDGMVPLVALCPAATVTDSIFESKPDISTRIANVPGVTSASANLPLAFVLVVSVAVEPLVRCTLARFMGAPLASLRLSYTCALWLSTRQCARR